MKNPGRVLFYMKMSGILSKEKDRRGKYLHFIFYYAKVKQIIYLHDKEVHP